MPRQHVIAMLPQPLVHAVEFSGLCREYLQGVLGSGRLAGIRSGGDPAREEQHRGNDDDEHGGVSQRHDVTRMVADLCVAAASIL